MRLLVIGLCLLGPSAAAATEEPDCGRPIAGSIFGTLLVLVALQITAYFLWKAYWKGKKGQHLVLVTDPEKGESVYAFDNPGFKEGPTIIQPEEKESQKLKWTQWNSIGFVSSSNPKVKAMDDSFTAQPTLNVVPLRSHDFTGLGFNICGNMRDGIFVKDVLHRGPASESGRIMPGDRIDSVKISLRHMVLEDALTILSYASPYEVELSVEARSGNTGTLLRTPPPPHRICHPFYRSHSISDIQQIGKMSSKRHGEQPSSLVSDLSGRDGSKPSTLDRKPKPVEAERNQNTRNCLIESVQKQENVFHTIELDRDETDQGKPKEASQNNVKSLLVKGIQNLKEKLHHSLHQEELVKSDVQEVVVEKKPKDDGFKTVELLVPEEVEKAGEVARTNRRSIVEEAAPEESDDPVAAKRKKGKAPMPPQREEEEAMSLESVDSEDSGGDKSGTTIELDSSHITVHHGPEGSEARKASSLGDLSRYEAADSVVVLERAVSLDLGDGPATKKRKAPAPPDPSPSDDEPTLKKSSVWGTLQDAINSDSETDLGISGCSTPDKTTNTFNFDMSEEEPVSSTPFKENEQKSFSAFKLGEPLNLTPFIVNDSGPFAATPNTFKLVESPAPSSFKTVTFSATVKQSDEEEEKYKPETKGSSDVNKEQVMKLSPSREAVSSCSWVVSPSFVTAINGGDETPPELPTSPMPALDSYVTEIQVVNDPTGFSLEGSEDQLMDQLNAIYKLDSPTGESQNGVMHQSEMTISIGQDDSGSKRVAGEEGYRMQKRPEPAVKPARTNVTVTNFKSTPSRIPVRAGPRSPSTSLSPASDKRTFPQRNGHGSP